jgi:hypothetical protein
MSALSNDSFAWWDQEFDAAGRPIRLDVRMAAQQFWKSACHKTRALVGEPWDAAALLERAVAQVSRYLDRRAVAPLSQDAGRVLRCAFYRGLRRHAARLRRNRSSDVANEISAASVSRQCTTKEDCKLDAEKTARHLTGRAQDMYQLRCVGHDWNEIAEVFGTTSVAARAEYSREIRRVRSKLRKGHGASDIGTPRRM